MQRLAFWFGIIFSLFLLGVMTLEPSVAGNKFETIGGGVSGSSSVKREYLQIILYVAGAIFLLGAILTVVVPKNNAQSLNYTLWKQSAAVLLGFSVISFLLALLS